MADYRCPNCSEYRGHLDNCSTGGIAAKARNSLYTEIRREVEEYFQRQRVLGWHPTWRGASKAIDEAWQNSGKTDRSI